MVLAEAFFARVDLWIKVHLAMGAALLVHLCITQTKTLRDVYDSAYDSAWPVNRIEHAKAQRSLMKTERGKS